MFGKRKFRMLTNYTDVAALHMAGLLENEGFEIYDLRESEVVLNRDNRKMASVYIICFKGKKRDYERFKDKYQLEEIIYEGIRTLM